MEFGEYVGTERQAGEFRLRASAAEVFAGSSNRSSASSRGRVIACSTASPCGTGGGRSSSKNLPGEENDGVFTLRTPDYQGDAANERTQDLTIALYTYAQQMQLAGICEERPEAVEFWQDIPGGAGLGRTSRTTGSRGSNISAEQASGWMIVPVDWEFGETVPREDVEYVPAWKVTQTHPSVIPTLMLPTWSGVEVRGGQVGNAGGRVGRRGRLGAPHLPEGRGLKLIVG